MVIRTGIRTSCDIWLDSDDGGYKVDGILDFDTNTSEVETHSSPGAHYYISKIMTCALKYTTYLAYIACVSTSAPMAKRHLEYFAPQVQKELEVVLRKASFFNTKV